MSATVDSSGYLSDAREQELAEYAEWIAEEYCPSRLVEPDFIAKEKGITVTRNDYGRAFDGLLEHQAGAFHIYCNTTRSRVAARARFTIAHELGHYFIDEHREALRSGAVPVHKSICDFTSKNPVEREADCFASNLLMPPSRLLRELAGRAISLETADHLAQNFGVSRTSTAVRLVRLDRVPCVVILHNRERFLWKWPSASARAAGLRSGLVDADQVPEDSATGKVLAAGDSSDGSPIRSVTTAATWFKGIALGSRGNFILREEAVSLGEYGVLTLLVLDESLR